MENETEQTPQSLIVARADGSFMRIKRVLVHADYVNADGSPRLNESGGADTGNYAISIDETLLAQFPQEIIQGLAHIYDAAL